MQLQEAMIKDLVNSTLGRFLQHLQARKHLDPRFYPKESTESSASLYDNRKVTQEFFDGFIEALKTEWKIIDETSTKEVIECLRKKDETQKTKLNTHL